jgi:TM2 domain-containing membrane protein YozV
MPGMRKPIQKKNPWIALILSLLITGLGQLYLRNYSRAAIFFGGTVLTGIFLSLYFSNENIMVFGVFMAVISAWDAYRQANKMNAS